MRCGCGAGSARSRMRRCTILIAILLSRWTVVGANGEPVSCAMWRLGTTTRWTTKAAATTLVLGAGELDAVWRRLTSPHIRSVEEDDTVGARACETASADREFGGESLVSVGNHLEAASVAPREDELLPASAGEVTKDSDETARVAWLSNCDRGKEGVDGEGDLQVTEPQISELTAQR